MDKKQKTKENKKEIVSKVIEVNKPEQKKFCDNNSFILSLVNYLKDMRKKRLVVDQNGLLNYMMSLGYTRSYVYLRIKAYQREITKRITSEIKEGTFEALIVERSRYDYDKKQGLLYELNGNWSEVNISKIQEVFGGIY